MAVASAGAANPPVVVAEGLSRRFGETLAVEELSLAIQGGEVFGLLGHNGAGKTTTVRLLNGVLTPSAGTIRVLGLDPVTQGPQVRARSGVLTETPSLDERLTARVTLRLYAEIFGVAGAEVNRRVDELLALFGLSERADEKVGGYSKGMRQRMALARTLIHKPDIIYLDEPTAALDPVATREVHSLIRNASQVEQRTVILCTHNLIEAERLCHRVAVLARGRVLAMGTPAELAEQYGSKQRWALEVDPASQDKAAQALARLPWDVAVENENHGALHVQGIARCHVPEAIALLVNEGVRIYAVSPIEATLEDVYFALQGKLPAREGSLPEGEPVAASAKAVRT